MSSYPYTLEPYKGKGSRYNCPKCKHNGTLSKYINTETGEQIPGDYGRCNRETNCGYHVKPPIETEPIEIKCLYVGFNKCEVYSPKAYKLHIEGKAFFIPKTVVFELADKHCYASESFLKQPKNQIPHTETDYKMFTGQYNSFNVPQPQPRQVVPDQKPFSLIPVEAFTESLKPEAYETNHFANYLIKLFGAQVASKAISRYYIGTSNHWNGATVFWQLDINHKVRAGKIILYSPTTGKRAKGCTNWAHSVLKLPDYVLKQCFFGEHLLTGNTKPVAIVESEKTAVIASVYLPWFIWLATGGKQGLNPEKCSVLKGRAVTLWPDLNCYNDWEKKRKELSHIAKFNVIDLLELKATEAEKASGFDLADYLVRFDLSGFIKSTPTQSRPEAIPEAAQAITTDQKPKETATQPERQPFKILDWSRKDIDELEKYFMNIEPPQSPINVNDGVITNFELFVSSHIHELRQAKRYSSLKPFYLRLSELRSVLSQPKAM